MNNVYSTFGAALDKEVHIVKRHPYGIPISLCTHFIKDEFEKNAEAGIKLTPEVEAKIRETFKKLPEDEKMAYLYLSKAGSKYQVSVNHAEIIELMSMYFLGIVDFPHTFSLDKGIALYGYYGVGKTSMFDNFKMCLTETRNPNNYYVTSIEQIIDHYREKNSIKKFYYNWHEGEKYIPFNLVINEFGSEIKGKHYGTDVNDIINELMMLRYEVFCNRENPKVTHITTNDNQQDLLKKLSSKLQDRLFQMFNFIELKGKSMRR